MNYPLFKDFRRFKKKEYHVLKNCHDLFTLQVNPVHTRELGKKPVPRTKY